jgi:hypothetical protein
MWCNSEWACCGSLLPISRCPFVCTLLKPIQSVSTNARVPIIASQQHIVTKLWLFFSISADPLYLPLSLKAHSAFFRYSRDSLSHSSPCNNRPLQSYYLLASLLLGFLIVFASRWLHGVCWRGDLAWLLWFVPPFFDHVQA